MATRKKHSPEEIVRKLQQADRLAAEGTTVAEICRQLQVAQPTYYKWRQQFAGMSVQDAKELKALREENARLKRLVAEAELEKLALREIAKGKF